MSAPQNFRKAFNGFNKEDVVQYLEYINTKHNNQVNQLTGELEALRAGSNGGERETRIEALQAECHELREKLAETEEKLAEAEEKLQQMENAQPQEVVAAENPSELEMYRRAERAEREAQEKAELIYYQVNSVLTEAAGKVDGASGEIVELADQIVSQLTKLQMMVGSSKQVLQDASALLNIIRPNK